MSNGNSPVTNPWAQMLMGVVIVVGLGFLAFLDKILNTPLFETFIAAYGVSGAIVGVYLMEQSGAIHSYIKFVVIIVASAIGYGFAQWASITMISVVSLATFVIAIVSFVAEDLQKYAPDIPGGIVNDVTLVIGGITVVATAVTSAPAGSIINVSTLLAVAVPALFIFIIQKVSPGATPTTSGITPTSSPPSPTTSATR